MPFVTNDAARIHWQAEGSGTPVLLIMGHRYDSSMWYPLIADLMLRHRVIVFDNRGTGKSDTTSDVTIEQLTSDALAVLDAAGEPRAHVYGVSMGGAIAAEFGMAFPKRVVSLTLGCTMLKTRKTERSLAARLIYRLPGWLMNKLMLNLTTPQSYGSATPIGGVMRDREAMARSAFTAKGLREQSRAMARYETTRKRARTLSMPVLVLHGDEDGVVPVIEGRELAAIVPGSIYVEFHGAGHNYLVSTGGAANEVFIDFIDRIDAGLPTTRAHAWSPDKRWSVRTSANSWK